MRRFHFIPAVIVVGFIACNSGADKSADNSMDTTSQSMDTMQHDMQATSVEPVPAIPAGAKVSFKNLKEGQTVTSPVKVEMMADGIRVDSAGAIKSGSGHHHLLIDAGDSMMAGEVIPKDSAHMHFGNAQKQAEVKLTPGKHTLTLQFADGIHRSYGGKLARKITVNVKK